MNYNELIRDIKDSPKTRTIFYPFGNYKFNKFSREYLASEYPAMVRKFYNCHEGERCFIAGNGPSLTAEDLDMIKGEYSFGTNKIYNIFPNTQWRPTYYICMDYMSMKEEIMSEKTKIEAEYLFLNWQQHKNIEKDEKIVLCNFNPHYVINLWNDTHVDFSEDCSKYIYNARTVTYSAIQFAAYMGFKEIYLMGVDANYPFYKDGKGRKHKTEAKDSHFKNGGYNRIDYMVKETNEIGYKLAKEYCNSHGIRIANATRGGKLEIFERVQLEKLFNN